MADEGQGRAQSPPYSNRGVTFETVVENIGEFAPEFDAYCATVRGNPLELIERLENALLEAGLDTQREDGPPVRFYDRNTLLLDASGHRHLSMRSGGRNGWPFVECKGPASPIVAELLREFFPHHSPSRIDSAYDLRGADVFEQLHRIAQATQARGIRLDYAGAAPEHPDRGTTIYLGSRKSQAFVRIYQKGLKHAEEMGLAPDEIPDELRHWVRVELELKPDKKRAKEASKSLSPEQVWGASPWLRRFAKEALSIDAERVRMHEKRETNRERALRYCLSQYGPHLMEQARSLGSWSELGRWIGSRLTEDEGDSFATVKPDTAPVRAALGFPPRP